MADKPLWQQRDPYAERLLTMTFDWRDERVLEWIAKFVEFGETDSKGNITRQRAISSGALLRSLHWRTWNDCGGKRQVFEAKYNYYSKFAELALGRGNPYIGLPPGIPGRKWNPIQMPDGRRRRAKPSIPTEMRKQAAKFITMLEDRYSYHGLALMVYALGPSIENQQLIRRLLNQEL